jgi:hypothetical protein
MSEPLTTQLIVDAGHPAVRIEVLDADYRVRASGYGRIQSELPTGFYTVQYKAVEAMEQREIALRPNQPLTLDEPPELAFASAAPLAHTAAADKTHQDNAQRLSRAEPLALGQGSQLFVFVRDVAPGGRTHPAKGLSLHRLSGERLALFDEVFESGGGRNQARWGGRNLALDPGLYRLRLALRRGRAIEMLAPACPNWQSQVFLLRQLVGGAGGAERVGETGGVDRGEGRAAGSPMLDFNNATQLMARPGEGFDPWRTPSVQKRLPSYMAGEDLRLIELARQALARGYRGIQTKDLYEMLWGKWSDPLLGILGLHLLLRQENPDLDLAETVIERLRGSILNEFRHPDVEIIALEVARRRGQTPEVAPFSAPPMLRASWNYLVQATAGRPDLIQPGSLASQIADRLWGASAWLIWLAPPEAPPPKEEASWIESYVQGVSSAAQSQIVELDDRVIIGGVTLFKSGASEAAQYGQKRRAREEAGAEEELAPQALEPKELIPPPEAGVDMSDFGGLQEAIIELLGRWEASTREPDLGWLTRKAKLTETEYALLVQFQAALPSRQSKYKASRQPPTLEELVLRLGAPAEMLQAATASLYAKLLLALSPSKAQRK